VDSSYTSHRLSIGNFYISFNNHIIYPEKFFHYYGISVTSFEELLGFIGENIVKQDTIMKQSIHPAERIVICLRYVEIDDYIRFYRCLLCSMLLHKAFNVRHGVI